jgi:hypothetical protein
MSTLLRAALAFLTLAVILAVFGAPGAAWTIGVVLIITGASMIAPMWLIHRHYKRPLVINPPGTRDDDAGGAA